MKLNPSSRLQGKRVFISEYPSHPTPQKLFLLPLLPLPDVAIRVRCRNPPSIALPTARGLYKPADPPTSPAGASGGIGAATAILFARAGANLIITARRQAELDVVAAEAKAANKEGGSGKGGEVITLVLDITDRAAVAAVLEKVPEASRKVDIRTPGFSCYEGTSKDS